MTIVVDVANVMGSRPDGWWRDRAGAAIRIYAELVRLAESGRPVPLNGAGPARPGFIMVLEGAAKAAAARICADAKTPGCGTLESAVEVRPGEVRVVEAPRSGDDGIVAVVRELAGDCYVVTADRELRERCAAEGAKILGPGWLLGLLRNGGLCPASRGRPVLEKFAGSGFTGPAGHRQRRDGSCLCACCLLSRLSWSSACCWPPTGR